MCPYAPRPLSTICASQSLSLLSSLALMSDMCSCVMVSLHVLSVPMLIESSLWYMVPARSASSADALVHVVLLEL